jgi:hypothetical protein
VGLRAISLAALVLWRVHGCDRAHPLRELHGDPRPAAGAVTLTARVRDGRRGPSPAGQRHRPRLPHDQRRPQRPGRHRPRLGPASDRPRRVAARARLTTARECDSMLPAVDPAGAALADALVALGTAAAAVTRLLDPIAPPWQIIAMIARGQLIAPVRSGGPATRLGAAMSGTPRQPDDPQAWAMTNSRPATSSPTASPSSSSSAAAYTRRTRTWSRHGHSGRFPAGPLIPRMRPSPAAEALLRKVASPSRCRKHRRA